MGVTGGRPPGRAHRVAAAVAVVLTVLLVVLLLWPDGFAVNRAGVRVYTFFLDRGVPPSVTPEAYAVALNVAVFVPLGWIGVSMLRWPPVRVVLALVAFSAAVELVQALPAVARDPSLLDVGCNALGAVLGALAASLRRRRRRHRHGATGDQARVDQPVDEGGDVGGDRFGG